MRSGLQQSGRESFFLPNPGLYSNSPIWQGYMTEKIIAPLQSRAIVLNWSARKEWRRSFAMFIP